MLRMTFVFGIAAVLAGAAGYATAGSAVPGPTTADREAKAPSARPRESAQDVSLKIDVEAKELVSTKDGTLVKAKVSVENNREGNARIAYAVEVVDDEGNFYVEPEVSDVKTLGARGRSNAATSRNLEVPSGLPDGYYQVRAHGGGIWDDCEEIGALGILYLRVRSGVVEVIDVNDYIWESKLHGEVDP